MNIEVFDAFIHFKSEILNKYKTIDLNINQFYKLFTDIRGFEYNCRRIDYYGWKKQTNTNSIVYKDQNDWNYYILSELLTIVHDQFQSENRPILVNSKYLEFFKQFEYYNDFQFKCGNFEFKLFVDDNIEAIYIGKVEIIFDEFNNEII